MASEVARLVIMATTDVSRAMAGLDQLHNSVSRAGSSTAAMGSQAQAAMAGVGGAFDMVSAKSVAMGNLMSGAIQTGIAKVQQLGQAALGAVVSYEKMEAQTAAMAAVEMVNLGQFKNFDDAIGTATEKSKELLQWNQALAISSPFGQEHVSSAMGAAQAFGFLATQYATTAEAQKAGVVTAQRLTESTMNWAAATGKAGHDIQRVVTIAGQIKGVGRLLGGDSMQLKGMGINLEAVLAKKKNVSTEQIMEMREKGAIPAGEAIDALMGEMEKFGSAAKLQSESVGGLIASLEDLQAVAQRNLFGPVFEAVKPQLSAAVAALQDPAVLGALGNIGKAAGAGMSEAITAITGAMAGLKSSGAIESLQGAMMALLPLGAALGGAFAAFLPVLVAVAGQGFNMLGAAVQTVAPILGTIIGYVGPLVSAMLTASTGVISFTTAFGAVNPALAPVGALIQSIVGFITPLMPVFVAAAQGVALFVGAWVAVGAVSAILTTLGAVLATVLSPVVLLGVAVGALAAAWMTDFMGIQTTVMSLLPVLTTIASVVGSVLLTAFAGLGMIASTLFVQMQSSLGYVLPTLMAMGSVVSDVLVGGFTMLATVAGGVFGGLPEIITTITGMVMMLTEIGISTLGAALTILGPLFLQAFGLIPTLVQPAMGLLQTLANVVSGTLITAFSLVQVVAQAAFGMLAAIIAPVLPAVASLAALIMNGLGTALQNVQALVGAAFSVLFSVVYAAQEPLTTIAGLIGGAIASGLGVVGQLVQMAFGGVATFVAAAVPALYTFADLVGPIIGNALNTLIPLIQGVFTNLGSAVASALPFVQQLALTVGGVLGAAFAALMGLMPTIISSVGSLLATAFGVAQAASGLFAQVLAVLMPVLTVVAQYAGPLLGGAFQILGAAAGLAVTFLTSMANTVGGMVISALNSLTEKLSGASAWAERFASTAGQHFETFRAIVAGVVAGVVGFLENLSSAAAIAGEMLVAVMARDFVRAGEAGMRLKEAVGVAMDGVHANIATGIAVAGVTLVEGTERMAAVSGATMATIPAIAGEEMDRVGPAVGRGMDAANSALTSKGETIVGNAQSIFQRAQAFLSQIGGGAASGGGGSNVADGIREQARAISEPLTQSDKMKIDAYKLKNNMVETGKTLGEAGNGLNTGAAATGGKGGSGGGAAKSAEEKIQQAAQTIATVSETAKKLMEFIGSGPLADLRAGEGADKIVAAAADMAQLGRRMADAFAAAAVGLKDDAFKAAQTLGQGISAAASAVSAVVGLLPKLWEFMQSDAWSEMQGSMGDILAVAKIMLDWGAALANHLVGVSGGITEESAKAAQAMGQAISASAGAVSAVIGLLPKLWEFIQAPEFDEIMASKDLIINAANQISSIGVAIYEGFAGAASGISAESSAAAQAASQGINAAVGSVSAITDLIVKLVDFLGDVGTASVIAYEETRNAIIGAAMVITEIGVAMFTHFAAAGAGITQKSVASAERLSKGITATTGAIGSTLDLIKNLLSFMGDGYNAWLMGSSLMRTWVAGVGVLVAQIGHAMFAAFAEAGSVVTQVSVNSAKRLSEGIGATVGAISATTDLISKLVAFMGDGYNAWLMGTELMRTWIAGVGVLVMDIGNKMLVEFLRASVYLSQTNVEAVKRLGDGIGSVMTSLGTSIDTLQKLLSFMGDVGSVAAIVAEGTSGVMVNIATRLVQIGAAIYGALAPTSSQMAQIAVDASKRLSEAVGAIGSAVSAMLDIFDRMSALMDDTERWAKATSDDTRKAMVNVAAELLKMGAAIYGALVPTAQGVEQNGVAAAKKLAEAISAMAGGVAAAMDTVVRVMAFVADKVNYAIVFFGGARTWLAGFVAKIAELGAMMADAFGRAGATLTGSVATAAKNLSDAVQATGSGIGAVIDTIGRMFDLMANNFLYAIAMSINLRGYFAGFAAAMADIALFLVNGFGEVAKDLLSTVAAPARALSEAITATAGGIKAVLDLLPLIARALAVPPQLDSDTVGELVTRITNWALRVVSAFGTAAYALDTVAATAGAKLGPAVEAALSGLTGALQLLELLGSSVTHSLASTVALQDFDTGVVDDLAAWARDMANAFNQAAVTLRQDLTSAGKALSEAIQTSFAGIKDAVELLSTLSAYRVGNRGSLTNNLAEGIVEDLTQFALRMVGAFNTGAARLEDGIPVLNQTLIPAGAALAGALGNALAGVKDAIELASIVATGLFRQTAPPDASASAAWVEALARWATGTANSFNNAAGALSASLVPSGREAGAALKVALDGFIATMTLLDIVKGAGARGLDALLSMNSAFNIAPLAEWAVRVANDFNSAASQIRSTTIPSGRDATEALRTTLDGMLALFELLDVVKGAGARGSDALLSMNASFDITPLVKWAVGVANAFALATDTLNTALAPLAADAAKALDVALGGIKATLDLGQILKTYAAQGAVVPDDALATRAFELATWGVKVANAFNMAALILSTSMTALGAQAGAAIKTTLDGLGAATELLTLLKGYAATTGLALPDDTLATRAFELGQWAVRVTNAFNLAADILATHLTALGSAATAAMRATTDGIKTALELMRLLGEYAILNPTPPSDALADTAGELAAWGARVANAFNLAAGTLNSLLVGQGQTLTNAVRSVLDTLTAVLDTHSLLVAFSEDWPEGPDGTLTAAATGLTSWAALTANAVNTAAGLLNTLLVPAGVALNGAARAVTDLLRSVVEAQSLLTTYAEDWPEGPADTLTATATALTTWAVTTANAVNTASVALLANTAPAASRLQAALASVLGGITSGIDLLYVLDQYTADFPLAPSPALANAATGLATWAVGIATGMNTAANVLSAQARSAISRVTAAMRSVTEGVGAGIDLARQLATYVEEYPAAPSDALRLAALGLASWAVEVANGIGGAATLLVTRVNTQLGVFSAALRATSEGVSAAASLVATLVGMTDADSPTPTPALVTFATSLAAWAVEVANAFAGAAGSLVARVVNSAGALSSAARSTLDGISAAASLVKLLTEQTTGETRIVPSDALITQASLMGDWAARAANAFTAAATSLRARVNAAATALSNAIQSTTSGLSATVALARLLTDATTGENKITFGSDLITQAQRLGTWAAEAANAFTGAASILRSRAADAAKALSEAVAATLEGLTATIGLVGLLAVQADPAKAVTPTEGLVTLAGDLGMWGARLANAFNTAAGRLTAALVPGGKLLAEAVRSSVDGITATIEAVTILRVAADPASGVAFNDGLETMARNLGGWAARIANAFNAAAPTFNSALNAAAAALGAGIKNALDGIKSTIELLAALAALDAKPIVVTATLFALADQLGKDAVTIASAFSQAALGWDKKMHDGIGALTSGIGSAADAILKMLDLVPRLMMVLPSYSGMPARLGANLDTLLEDIKNIFLAFALKAKDPRITDAAADAAGVLASGFGDALSAITGALDLMDRLLDPQERPQIGAISQFLAPIFDVVEEVFNEFKTRATQYTSSDVASASALATAVNGAFTAVESVSKAVKSFEALHIESSGFNNISALLFNIFGLFDKIKDKTESVAAAGVVISAAARLLETLRLASGASAALTMPSLAGLFEGIDTAKVQAAMTVISDAMDDITAAIGLAGTDAADAWIAAFRAALVAGTPGLQSLMNAIVDLGGSADNSAPPPAAPGDGKPTTVPPTIIVQNFVPAPVAVQINKEISADTLFGA